MFYSETIKRRIVKLDEDRYVPQYFREHFLFGGEWNGLGVNEHDNLYSYADKSTQLDRCVVGSYEEAQKILDRYFSKLEDKGKLS